MKKINKNTIKVREIVNVETGEVFGTTAERISYSAEPDYIKMYLDDLGRLNGLTGTENTCLRILLRKMNWDNEIYIHKKMREDISKELNITRSSFYRYIDTYINGGILMKVSTNLYLFNPNLFAKGSWNDISKLRMTIEYSKEGRIIKTNFSKNLDATQLNLEL